MATALPADAQFPPARLRACVRISRVLDDERALLNPGTGTVIVIDNTSYLALQEGELPAGQLRDELARAGFLERND